MDAKEEISGVESLSNMKSWGESGQSEEQGGHSGEQAGKGHQ